MREHGARVGRVHDRRLDARAGELALERPRTSRAGAPCSRRGPGPPTAARCVQSPSSSSSSLGLDQLGEVTCRLGRGADAVHAGVDLEVHGQRRRRARVVHRLGRRRDRFRGVERRTHAVEPGDVDELAQRRLGEHEHRLRSAARSIAHVDGLVDQRDAEPRRAAGDGGRRGAQDAVAVAPPLDDGAQRGRRRPASASSLALCSSAPRSTSAHAYGRSSGCTSTRYSLPRSSNTTGRPSSRSLATSPRRGPSAPARPWSHAPAAAARSGCTPCASSAPMMPGQHVARAGGGEARVASGDEQRATLAVGDRPGSRPSTPRSRSAVRASSPRRVDPVGAGRVAREALVLAVVRGEHGTAGASTR